MDPPMATIFEGSGNTETPSLAPAGCNAAKAMERPIAQPIIDPRRTDGLETKRITLSSGCRRVRNARQVLGQKTPVVALAFAFMALAEELDDHIAIGGI